MGPTGEKTRTSTRWAAAPAPKRDRLRPLGTPPPPPPPAAASTRARLKLVARAAAPLMPYMEPLACPSPPPAAESSSEPSSLDRAVSWTLRAADCDDDGVTDWVCTDTAGHRGVIRSAAGCSVEDQDTGWPTAPDSYCPALLACARPDFWCDPNLVRTESWTLSAADCDDDGVTDWVCTDTASHRGVIRSTAGCSVEDQDTGWPTAPDSYCPTLL
ncbi:hypothetical protein TSOC_009907, partial [Tetrabaena socialis]